MTDAQIPEVALDPNDGMDVSSQLNLPADPTEADRSVFIPATPYTPATTVSNIPTAGVLNGLAKGTKAHVAAAIAAVSGFGQVAIQFLPNDGAVWQQVKTYVAAGVGIITVGAMWLGVYQVPNLPKFTQKS